MDSKLVKASVKVLTAVVALATGGSLGKHAYDDWKDYSDSKKENKQ